MKIAIIGSRNTTTEAGQLALEHIAHTMLDPLTVPVTIGSFANGGVHQAAYAYAEARGWHSTRFYQPVAMGRWKPDHALILWDGISRGCQVMRDILTQHHAHCLIFLVSPDGAVRYLGDNSNDLSKART